jgi:hypothetical protein
MKVIGYTVPLYPPYVAAIGYVNAFYASQTRQFFHKPPHGTVCFDYVISKKFV